MLECLECLECLQGKVEEIEVVSWTEKKLCQVLWIRGFVDSWIRRLGILLESGAWVLARPEDVFLCKFQHYCIAAYPSTGMNSTVVPYPISHP
jgi:hypothetical protein